jgi:phage terminase large subunit-like protein
LLELAALPTLEQRDRKLRATTDRFLVDLFFTWVHNARLEQWPPPGDWTLWLFLGGRGAGKTRAGAEWVRMNVEAGAAGHVALIGETFADVREVMVDGVSGLKGVYRARERPRWETTRRRLLFRNGAVAHAFSSEDPEALRGPQFDLAWCDELAKWRHAEATFDMLQFGLRLGDRPRQMVTTTPRPIPLLKRLIAAPGTVLTRAASEANARYLAPAFLRAIVEAYRGTALGRQELDGELVEDRADALWTRGLIEARRVRTAPGLRRIVIAVDPAVSGRRASDHCGIVAAGLSDDGCGYVLEDLSLKAHQPEVWAERAVAAFHRLNADALVVEVNQGGDLVASVIAAVDATVPVTPVRATRGKWLRAEPIAALTAQGRVKFVGAFPALEDELCDFGPDGLSGGRSPDRLDAMVWALTALRLGTLNAPRLRRV